MHFPTSILLLLSLLPAMPLRDLKAPGRPPIASLSPGLPNPHSTPIETRAGEGAGYSVSCYPLQGGKTGGRFKRVLATEGVWLERSQIVFGPWHGPDELWPVPRDEHDQAFSLGTDALDEESEEEGLEVQEQACLALIEGVDVGSLVSLPGSFPTPHACLSIESNPRVVPLRSFSPGESLRMTLDRLYSPTICGKPSRFALSLA